MVVNDITYNYASDSDCMYFFCHEPNPSFTKDYLNFLFFDWAYLLKSWRKYWKVRIKLFDWFPGKPRVNHGFYISWLLISLCAHMEYIRHFDCWRHLFTSKESSDPIFSGKRPIFHYTCATCSELPSWVNREQSI